MAALLYGSEALAEGAVLIDVSVTEWREDKTAVLLKPRRQYSLMSALLNGGYLKATARWT